MKPSNTKTAKFHKLIHLLQTHTEGLHIQQMAAALAVDERTVKRYLSDLRHLHYNLTSLRAPAGGKIQYAIKSETSTPEHFIPALKKIRSELHAGGNPKYSALIGQLVRFLETQGASRREQDEVSESPPASDVYFVDHGPFAENNPSTGMLKILERAIASRTMVRLTYSGYGTEKGEFAFYPYVLSLRVGTLYLIGRQGENRGPFKTLSVKRIKRSVATRDVFKRDAFDPNACYKYCFGQWPRQPHENPETVLLAVHSPWIEKYLSESHFNPPGKMVRKGKQVLFEVKVVIKPDFENWILSLVPDLTPVKPESLCRTVADRLREGLNRIP